LKLKKISREGREGAEEFVNVKVNVNESGEQ